MTRQKPTVERARTVDLSAMFQVLSDKDAQIQFYLHAKQVWDVGIEMHKVKSADLIFEKAKQAFEAGDFAAAVKYAKQAEDLLTVELCVSRRSPKSPTYSIILVSYANSTDIGESLQPLARFCGQDAFEIIIVDNGNENIQQLDTNVFSDVSVIDVEFNYGCSGGRNLGARFGRGEFVIFLDDDGIIQDGAVEQLIDTIRVYDAVAVRGRVRPRSATGLAARHYDLVTRF